MSYRIASLDPVLERGLVSALSGEDPELADINSKLSPLLGSITDQRLANKLKVFGYSVENGFTREADVDKLRAFLGMDVATKSVKVTPHGKGRKEDSIKRRPAPMVKQFTKWDIRSDTIDSSTVLKSFVPNMLLAELLAGDGKEKIEASSFTFTGVCLLVDISGFTRLSGKFCDRGKEGIDDLQRVVNGYMGQLVKTVYDFRGDVIKFAGDALVCVFDPKEMNNSMSKEGEGEREGGGSLPETCAQALRCALVLQNICTDELTVHVALSCGEICFASLGGADDMWECLVSGRALGHLSQCLDLAPSKNTVATAQVIAQMELLQATITLQAELLEDNNYHITSITPSTSSSPSPFSSSSSSSAPIPDAASEPTTATSDASKLEVGDRFGRHPNHEAFISKVEKYVPWPVLQGVKHGSFEILAELRKVTTMFMKFDDYDDAVHQDLLSLQPYFHKIQTIVALTGGFIRQFLVDDKGCVIIVLWGVPSATHVDNASRALSAGVVIGRTMLESMNMKCSIGITTGNAYCGTVGSQTRREYAAIGDCVNLAARLMGKAKGNVLIDQNTHTLLDDSSLLKQSLEALEPITVKGKDLPITPFSYKTSNSFLPVPDLTTLNQEEEEGDDDRRVLQSSSSNNDISRNSSSFRRESNSGVVQQSMKKTANARKLSTQIGNALGGLISFHVTPAETARETDEENEQVVGLREECKKVFVARLVELLTFREEMSAWRRTKRLGVFKTVIIEGRIGTGKRESLDWLKDQANNESLRIITVRASKSQAVTEYYVMGKLFRQLLQSENSDENVSQKYALSQLLKVLYKNDSETARLVAYPTLKVLGVKANYESIRSNTSYREGGSAQHRVPPKITADCIREIFQYLLQEQPTILVVVATHYCDEQSLKALLSLTTIQTPTLMVMTQDANLLEMEATEMALSSTSSSEGMSPEKFLSLRNRFLQRTNQVTLVELSNYSLAEVGAYLRKTLGRGTMASSEIVSSTPRSTTPKHGMSSKENSGLVEDEVSQELKELVFQLSGGNPFWVHEIGNYIHSVGVKEFISSIGGGPEGSNGGSFGEGLATGRSSGGSVGGDFGAGAGDKNLPESKSFGESEAASGGSIDMLLKKFVKSGEASPLQQQLQTAQATNSNEQGFADDMKKIALRSIKSAQSSNDTTPFLIGHDVGPRRGSGSGLAGLGIGTTKPSLATSRLETFIICRLEKLSVEEQAVLRTVSIFDENFTERLLEGILSSILKKNLTSTMRTLVKENWLMMSRRSKDSITTSSSSMIMSEAEFTFAHPFMRQVVYELTPLSGKQRLHGTLANYIEETFHGDPTYFAAICYHYIRAGESMKSKVYEYASKAAAHCAYSGTGDLQEMLGFLTIAKEAVQFDTDMATIRGILIKAIYRLESIERSIRKSEEAAAQAYAWLGPFSGLAKRSQNKNGGGGGGGGSGSGGVGEYHKVEDRGGMKKKKPSKTFKTGDASLNSDNNEDIFVKDALLSAMERETLVRELNSMDAVMKAVQMSLYALGSRGLPATWQKSHLKVLLKSGRGNFTSASSSNLGLNGGGGGEGGGGGRGMKRMLSRGLSRAGSFVASAAAYIGEGAERVFITSSAYEHDSSYNNNNSNNNNSSSYIEEDESNVEGSLRIKGGNNEGSIRLKSSPHASSPTIKEESSSRLDGDSAKSQPSGDAGVVMQKPRQDGQAQCVVS